MIDTQKIWFIIFISLALFLQGMETYAQQQVNRVIIDPLNRVTIYCSQEPAGISTTLSSDKKKITIVINNAKVEESARKSTGNGVIEDVYIQTMDKRAEISIVLKEKRGYTATPLKYSKAIMIEVFNWDKLSPAEDNYRSGLLALEDGINQTATKYLSKASKSGLSNAAAILGLVLLEQGSVNAAYESLNFAEKSGMNIPDAYAALSQIYNIKGDKAKSESYRKLFLEKTGLKDFAEMQLSNKMIYDKGDDNLPFILESLDSASSSSDSADKKYSDTSSLSHGKDNSNLTSNIKKDSSIKSDSSGILPGWAMNAAIYVVIIALLMSFILLTSYLRWRKKQLTIIKSKSGENKNKFQDKLNSAKQQMSGRAYMTNLYKKNDPNLDKTIKDETLEQVKAPIEKTITKQKEKSPVKTGAAKPNNDLEQLAQMIIQSKKEEQEKTDTSNNKDFDYMGEGIEAATNPKLELAMHLHDEQMKLKQKNLRNIDAGQLPVDSEKLKEIAKKLGIEQGALETKRTLNDLEKNEGTMQKLKEKFFKPKKK